MPVERFVEPASSIVGHIAVPGDRSISHAALLVAAVSDDETRIGGFGRSAETEATIAAVRALGAEVDEEDVDTLVVRGVGRRGVAEPPEPIDCASSGTLLHLLAGMLAGQQGRRFELTAAGVTAGAIERLADPLRKMGARVATNEGRAGIRIEGADLTGIAYELPAPRAELKSALLLAGLYARGRTSIKEHVATKDHVELLLAAAGVNVYRRGGETTITAAERVTLGSVEIPGDVSAAAPFVAAATLLTSSELIIHGVGLNPTRTGFLEVLAHMGARITVVNRGRLAREQVGDVDVRHAELVAASVAPAEASKLEDELPLTGLAAGSARGRSRVRFDRKLAEDERDRIETVTTALRALGIRVAPSDDGFGVRGVPTRPKGGGVVARGDHTIAILGGAAGVVSREGVRVSGADAVARAFPGFFDLLEEVARRP